MTFSRELGSRSARAVTGAVLGALLAGCSPEAPPPNGGRAALSQRNSVHAVSAAPPADLVAAQQQKFNPSDGAADDRFGWSLSISGETALVGAPDDTDLGADSGSAYVFVRSGSVWSFQQKLLAGDGAVDDQFGISVALSGTTALVGVPWDDDRGSQSGSAHVFVRTGTSWSLQQKLTAPDGVAGDFFGYGVALSGDTAVVGAFGDDDQGDSSGSAYAFVRTGTTWAMQQKLLAMDGSNSGYFGQRVSVSGGTVLVGANQSATLRPGSAYVFARSGTTFRQEAKLMPSNATGEYGSSVSVSNDTAVVGDPYDPEIGSRSGAAYVFTRTGSTWSERQKLLASDGAASDMFGRSVYVDGDRILVGGDGDDSLRGSAYLFLRSGTSFIEASKLTASDAAMSDYFGGSLSLSGDTALIAAIGDDDHGELSGSAYVFVLVGGPCDADVDCASAHCVEGVCCDATCSSPCDVCTEALGAATDGRCAVAPAGYPGSPACAPQACTGASAACGACTGSSDCPPDRYCASSGGCLLRKDRGEPCSYPGDCTGSGCRACATGLSCVDGVCCDSACSGPCDACSVALGAATDGTCAPIAAGSVGSPACTSPFACNGSASTCPMVCATDADCVSTHYCYRDGSCQLRKQLGTGCSTVAGADCNQAGCRVCQGAAGGNCVDNVCCDSACAGGCNRCSGLDNDGTCTSVASGTPGAPACAGGLLCTGGPLCPGECLKDSDCPESAFCDENGECREKLGPGDSCTRSAECGDEAPVCTDGSCCESRCTGQCEACDATGACSPVEGAPRGEREPCGGAGSECGGSCDGRLRAACVYPPSGTACGAAACADAFAESSECNGQGECTPGNPVSCAPYGCAGDRCGTSCESDTDCAGGNACVDAECQPAAGKCSADGTTVLDENDEPTRDCTPFLCMSGLCRTSCATTSDCAPDFSCNPANQRCEAVRSPETADDSGCGCRTAPGRADQRRRREVPGGGLGLLMLGIALTALRRRRALRGPAFPAGRHR